LGNRRLAILDLSAAGHQPMWSPDGRYVISFNGEIYNHDNVREELGIKRSDLRSTTDTEILLRAWGRWRAGSLDRLVGQWAFALFDTLERRLWLCRDRFGEKPLFYHRGDAAFTFASSIPALIEAPWVPRSLDDDAIREYATLRYVVSPRTVVSSVFKVPGGHLLRVSPDGVESQRWYAPRFRPHAARRSRAALVEEFDSLFGQASTRCLVSDVPVALLLSDGIDSNSIRAAISERGREVRSFTYTLAHRRSGLTRSESADSGGAASMDLRVTPPERVRQMVPAFGSLNEPVGDGAALATWLLIRNAREHATVFLCGHGGDEVLGGYRLSQDRFRLAAIRGLARLPLPVVRKLLERFLYGVEPVESRRRALLDEPPRRAPAVASYLIHRPLPVNDLHELFGPSAPAATSYLDTVDRLYADCLGTAGDLDRMQEVMLQTFLSENILSFADATAMDSSAELRMPFLDRDLVDFVLSLPMTMRVSRWPGRANTKRILRWWSRGRMDSEIISRRKRAFPFGNLPELLMGHADTLRGYVLDSRGVRRVVPGAEQWLRHPPEYFRGPWEGTLWALLALGIWSEQHGIA
ncbi:MAG: asparagine synthase (glutamine-hydrolyzing), partial [bacterium]